jgi:hypothetical protein
MDAIGFRPVNLENTMMKLTAVLLLSLFALIACEEQGPFERAGEELDEASKDIRTEGQTLGNRLDDAADDVRDNVEDAADELDKR